MKDGPEGANFTSRLEVIEVGTNDLGKPITSCAIVPSDAAVVETGPKLTKTQQLAYDALNSPRLGGSNSTICMTPKNRRPSGRPYSAPPSTWRQLSCSCWPGRGNMSTCWAKRDRA
jgi:hypothetical protein